MTGSARMRLDVAYSGPEAPFQQTHLYFQKRGVSEGETAPDRPRPDLPKWCQMQPFGVPLVHLWVPFGVSWILRAGGVPTKTFVVGERPCRTFVLQFGVPLGRF